MQVGLASFPDPCPAFCRFQYRKPRRTWYLSSHEHDVVIKKFQNEQAVFCIFFNQLFAQCLVCMTYMVYLHCCWSCDPHHFVWCPSVMWSRSVASRRGGWGVRRVLREGRVAPIRQYTHGHAAESSPKLRRWWNKRQLGGTTGTWAVIMSCVDKCSQNTEDCRGPWYM